MSRSAIIARLTELHACLESIAWVESLPADVTWHQAWDACERGDWLLWLLPRIGVDRHWAVAAACACARGVRHLMRDQRSVAALECAERWSQGRATDDEIRSANAAAAAAAAYAAYAYADAAYAAAAYAAYAVRTKTLARMAKIVRKHDPTPPRMR